ncbi:MAG: cobalamin-dependent protein [Alphaproteobacteria bacterium]|nr:cobalamin-dependent protein [Alphaproteobacteria bacterium]
MAARVFIGDLRYNYGGILASDCMPLGIAYIKAVMDKRHRADAVGSRLFVYPDRLLAALKESPPDVLMLSNYVWNEELSHEFFRIAKQLNPNVLTVMGGPNISLEAERQATYLDRHPALDVYALGEADFLATDILEGFMDAGMSVKRFGAKGMDSIAYRTPEGQVVVNKTKPRHRDVEQIPSAWLTGIQDEFFDGRLAPMIETNRGCPFTCTFCVQGTSFYTKVHNFPIEQIKEEIHYIARRIKERSPKMGTLRIADSNYGMFERDVEISGFIGQMQRDYGWPTFIDATTGKNRPERIIKSVEQVSGALVLYQAVQSLDEDVLRKVKRQNIKLDAYKQIEVHMRGRGLRSVSDLILGLPGESLESHLRALHTLLDSNIHQMHNFQAMVLKGSEMETLACREMFGFDTRFRVLPKNFGVFENRKVFDVEEIIVATDTLPFEDYITCRKWHLVSSVFWNDGWFEAVVRFMRAHGIKNSEWWAQMLPAMENGSQAMRDFLDSFVGETKGELFPTRESCAEFCARPENFAKLERGEIGDNLMYRYRAIASFHIWSEVCATAMAATRRLLEERGIAASIPDFDRFWRDFHTYVELIHATGRTEAEILAPAAAVLHYDIAAWLAAGEDALAHPEAYRLAEPTSFDFELSEAGRRELESSLATWTTHVRGLSKLVTRIKVESQIRGCKAARALAPA